MTSLGFQGGLTDASTDGVWMGARWYWPGTSTFTSRDTVFGQLGTPISLNRYTYAWANPTGMWDPDGRESRDLCSSFGGEVSLDDLVAFAENGAAAGCAATKSKTVLRDAAVGTVTFAASGVAGIGCGVGVGFFSGWNPVAVGAAGSVCGQSRVLRRDDGQVCRRFCSERCLAHAR